MISDMFNILKPMANARLNALSLDIEKIKSIDELAELDSKLNDKHFFYATTQRIDADINAEDANSRIHQALDRLFDRNFFATCSWSGRGNPEPKHKFSEFKNVLRFFNQ